MYIIYIYIEHFVMSVADVSSPARVACCSSRHEGSGGNSFLQAIPSGLFSPLTFITY